MRGAMRLIPQQLSRPACAGALLGAYHVGCDAGAVFAGFLQGETLAQADPRRGDPPVRAAFREGPVYRTEYGVFYV